MENLRYFEVEISNNNTIDRSVSGDESDRTILILGTREPESLEEMERFIFYNNEISDEVSNEVAVEKVVEEEPLFNGQPYTIKVKIPPMAVLVIGLKK